MNELFQTTLMEGFLAFARIAGCFLVLPGFSSVRVPQSVRIVFVLALTGAIGTFIPSPSIQLATIAPVELSKLLFTETTIGAMLGLSVRIYLLAISFTATALSTMIGFNALAAPSALDGELEPALATIISFAALLVMFAMDFHHNVIAALINSYQLAPTGAPVSFSALASDLTRVLSDSFLIVFRLGSPFIAYALIANLFIALLNKLTPALQLYFIASPGILLGGLLLAYFVFPLFLSFTGEGIQMLGPIR